jgi:hypothetical protein
MLLSKPGSLQNFLSFIRLNSTLKWTSCHYGCLININSYSSLKKFLNEFFTWRCKIHCIWILVIALSSFLLTSVEIKEFSPIKYNNVLLHRGCKCIFFGISWDFSWSYSKLSKINLMARSLRFRKLHLASIIQSFRHAFVWWHVLSQRDFFRCKTVCIKPPSAFAFQ